MQLCSNYAVDCAVCQKFDFILDVLKTLSGLFHNYFSLEVNWHFGLIQL